MTLRTPRSVVLVEDDVETAGALAAWLRALGHQVDVALDGVAAVARLAEGPRPDLLVTEWRVPHADAQALVPLARSRWPGLPVVVAIADAEEAARWSCGFNPSVLVLPGAVSIPGLKGLIPSLGEGAG